MVCTFFGHRMIPLEIEPSLRSTLVDLIRNYDVNYFYVGNYGQFDSLVLRLLQDLSLSFSIEYQVVFAYMSKISALSDTIDDAHTLLPEGIETVPKRFAIFYCNQWMIEHSDFVVTYVDHNSGSSAARFKQMAENKGKNVIDLYSNFL